MLWAVVLRMRIVAVVALSVLFLAIAVNVGNVYALNSPAGFPSCASIGVSPNPVLQGTMFTVFGHGCSPLGDYWVFVYDGACPGTFLSKEKGTTDASGNFAVSLSSSGLAVGDHCFDVVNAIYIFFESTFTVAATPIPEYPLSLPILAIFMIIAYGVIRRKTVTKQK